MSPAITPSQTVGPFFSIGLPWETGPLCVPRDAGGAIEIAGTVYDGAGDPVPDALIEIWQADPAGRFADLHEHGGPSALPGFRGFARAATDDDGRFAIVTVKPGAVPSPRGGNQAPHIDLSVFARGMLHRYISRIYFADEPRANAEDPVLSTVPADRRDTLLALAVPGGYEFHLRLQGEGETVFFEV